jgi:dTDP-4-dehydrorhamnose 3,5-epimerase
MPKRVERDMIFAETPLKNAYVIDIERIEDERGFFARCWCREEAETHGLNPCIVQCSTSVTKVKGTLRGMHYQVEPCREAKLIRCTKGAVYDVIVDIRPESSTYAQHFGTVLSAENRRLMYAPEGFAHGFLTLEDDVEIFYQISEYYSPKHARGFRWNDPLFSIRWPAEIQVISERDRTYPDFSAPEM